MTRATPLTIIVDRREQRPLWDGLPEDKADETPLWIGDRFEARWGTLGEGDYALEGYEAFARIERKSGQDLLQTITWEHDRFDLELARLLAYQRAVVVVDDCTGYASLEVDYRASPETRATAEKICRSLERKARLPIVFCRCREKAAWYVEKFFAEVADDFDPRRLARAKDIALVDVTRRLALDLPPFASEAARFADALAALAGLCKVCGRRAPKRPKPAGLGVCACGRTAPEVGLVWERVRDDRRSGWVAKVSDSLEYFVWVQARPRHEGPVYASARYEHGEECRPWLCGWESGEGGSFGDAKRACAEDFAARSAP